MTQPRILSLFEVRGSPEECGEQYGEAFGPHMLGFFSQEAKKHKGRYKLYAAQCWRYIQESAPHSAEFIQGMAKSSGMSALRLVTLLLHEELFQITRQGSPHCTCFAAKALCDGRSRVVVGENWDWPPIAYPWPGLLRMSSSDFPRILSYHYPGLWTALGINEYGLALMWTSGYNVPVLPAVGLPTYVLIAEILQHKTVDKAVEYY